MPQLSRRTVLAGSALMLPALAARPAFPEDAGGFAYEVTRTEQAWRDLLGDAYAVMREGETEKPHSSPLAKETGAGEYDCKGCDLTLYQSRWKRPVDKGWVFFAQSEPDAMLMSVDQLIPDDAVEVTPAERMQLDDEAAIEVHCRRCGSHIGHIFIVDGALLHCSNGSAMTFRPTEA